jgi:hypothetical protein
VFQSFTVKCFFDKIYNQYSDNEGRMCAKTAFKEDENYCFIIIYAPNDHFQSHDIKK